MTGVIVLLAVLVATHGLTPIMESFLRGQEARWRQEDET